MIETKQLYEVTSELTTFIDECDKLGFKNNNSLKEMKWQRTLDEGGCWFATFVDDQIVGLSGIHPFKDGWRALFRGAQLYSIPGGLSKNHMNCWMFYYHLPLVIDLVKNDPVYITTNTENDASGYMTKVDKLYKILCKKRIVDHVSFEFLNGVDQNIWKLNKEMYYKVRQEK